MDLFNSKEFNRRSILKSPLVIGDEDFISNLPYDCLLRVFSFLEGNTLEVMKVVNQRLSKYSHQEQFNVRKSEAGELVIAQDKSVNSFYLNRLGWIAGLSYHIKISNGKVDSCRSWVEKPYSFYQMIENDGNVPKATIPSELFDNINEVYVKKRFNSLVLRNVLLDKEALDRCLSIIEANPSLNSIYLRVAYVNYDVDSNEFSKYMLATTIRHLKIFAPDPKVEEAINEQFLREFSADSSFTDYTIEVEYNYRRPSFWQGTRTILPIICGFELLKLRSLVLTTDLIIELIDMRLGMPLHREVEWVLSSNEIPTSEQLRSIGGSKHWVNVMS